MSTLEAASKNAQSLAAKGVKSTASQGPGVLLKLTLMHHQQLRKKAQRLNSSSLTYRTSGMSISYPKTRIRGSRLLNAARILALLELTHRLHQAYRQAYDKQAADQLLPQNPTPEERAANRAADLLRNNDCANFIAELISLGASVAGQPGGLITPSFAPIQGLDGSPTPSYGADYGLREYRTAISGGRVTASGRSGTSGNTVTYGTTTNYSTISWNREFYSLGRDDQARHTLHESLHLIPNFSDFALAGAASIIATRGRNNPGNTGNFRNQSAASQYLNQQIARHCR